MIKLGCNFLSLRDTSVEDFIKICYDLRLDVVDFHAQAFVSTDPALPHLDQAAVSPLRPAARLHRRQRAVSRHRRGAPRARRRLEAGGRPGRVPGLSPDPHVLRPGPGAERRRGGHLAADDRRLPGGGGLCRGAGRGHRPAESPVDGRGDAAHPPRGRPGQLQLHHGYRTVAGLAGLGADRRNRPTARLLRLHGADHRPRLVHPYQVLPHRERHRGVARLRAHRRAHQGRPLQWLHLHRLRGQASGPRRADPPRRSLPGSGELGPGRPSAF